MDVLKAVKTESSKWLKKQGTQRKTFEWQNGYGIFSVSESNVALVKTYIARQKQHHAKMLFQDEYREICRRHGIEIDERYVWD
jgi:hypothetical protein